MVPPVLLLNEKEVSEFLLMKASSGLHIISKIVDKCIKFIHRYRVFQVYDKGMNFPVRSNPRQPFHWQGRRSLQ